MRKVRGRNVEIGRGNLMETRGEGRECRTELSSRDTLYLNSDSDDTDSLYDGHSPETENITSQNPWYDVSNTKRKNKTHFLVKERLTKNGKFFPSKSRDHRIDNEKLITPVEGKNTRFQFPKTSTQVLVEVNPDIYLPEESPENDLLSTTTPPRCNSPPEIATPSTLPWSPSPASPPHPSSPSSSCQPGKGPGNSVSSRDEPPDSEDFDDTLHALKYKRYKGNHHMSFSSDSDNEMESDIFWQLPSPTSSRPPGQGSGDETPSRAEAGQDQEDFDDTWHGLKYKRYRGDIQLSISWDSDDGMEIRVDDKEEVSVNELLDSSEDIDEYYENIEKLQTEHEFKGNEETERGVKANAASLGGGKQIKDEVVTQGCTEEHNDKKVYSNNLADDEATKSVDAITDGKVNDKTLKIETTIEEDVNNSVVGNGKKLIPTEVKTDSEKISVGKNVKPIDEPVNTKTRNGKRKRNRTKKVVENDHANVLPDSVDVSPPGIGQVSPNTLSSDYQEVQIPIPHHLRGLVIGRHGHFIRSIISATGTFIFFHPVSVFCTIQGNSRGVERAIRIIQGRLAVGGSRDFYYP